MQVALFCRWKKLRAVLCREELRWDVEIAHSWCSSWGEFAALRMLLGTVEWSAYKYGIPKPAVLSRAISQAFQLLWVSDIFPFPKIPRRLP